jgi:hypothetical protein
MKEIGWIESKEELEAFVAPGRDDGEEGPETEAAGEDSVDPENPLMESRRVLARASAQ